MSVSDETAGGTKRKPDWKAIRDEYETSKIAHRPLAAKHCVPYPTLKKRARREGWTQAAKLVRATAERLDAAAKVKAAQMVADQLQPWIEERKPLITKRGYNVGDVGLSKAAELMDAIDPADSKGIANVARAAETFLRMARTSLGMNEGIGVGGAINVSILANQAAVQVAAPAQ